MTSVMDAAEGDVVRSECAEDGFEVVDELGEGCVFEGGAEAGGVERDFHGGVAVDGEAEAAGGVGLARESTDRCAMNGAPGLGGGRPANRSMVSAGGGSGSASAASASGSAAISSAMARASSKMAMARPLDSHAARCRLPAWRLAGFGEECGDFGVGWA